LYSNRRGFNVFDGSQGRCRYGNIMNNENECLSSDAVIGLGCWTNNDNGRRIGSGGFRWDPTILYPLRSWIYVR
jgi:hypothetical protein